MILGDAVGLPTDGHLVHERKGVASKQAVDKQGVTVSLAQRPHVALWYMLYT